MKNIYRGTAEHPFHLSVGAVLFNDKKEVACHYFEKFNQDTDSETAEDFYILMRETLENGESPEQAVLRGLKEEFGATGEIMDFIGSIKSEFKRVDVPIEKTTLYYLVSLKEIDPELRLKDDEEGVTEIHWFPVDFLIEEMKKQGEKFKRTDLNESVILERAKKYLYNS